MAADQTAVPATLAALADRVGVSRTTVSNAYNRPDQLSPALRAKILTAAIELGYPGPDPVARSLRTRQADAVGLIFTERLGLAFGDPGSVEFLHGLAEACSERHRSLLIMTADPDAGNTDIVSRAAVDGFVLYSMGSRNAYVDAVLGRRQPTVIVDAPIGVPTADFVGIDDRAAFATIASHVLGSSALPSSGGQIGVVTQRRWEEVSAGEILLSLRESLRLGRSPHPVRQDRLLGLADALTAAAGRVSAPGAAPTSVADVVVSERPANSREQGSLGAALLLDARPGLRAIMATTDLLALGVLDELRVRGLRAGADVVVTGFDDIAAAGPAGLTTIRQPMQAKGRSAVASLLDPRPGPGPTRTILATELVVRASSTR